MQSGVIHEVVSVLCTHPVVAMMTLVRRAAALPAAIRGGEGRGATLLKLQKNVNYQGKGAVPDQCLPYCKWQPGTSRLLIVRCFRLSPLSCLPSLQYNCSNRRYIHGSSKAM